MEFELRVYGMESASLVHIDVDLSRKVKSALHIPWAMVDQVYELADQFDLIILTEDDILVNPQTLRALISIDRKLKPNEMIIPNRIEKFLGFNICVDMFAYSGWLKEKKIVSSLPIQSARNTHSAFLLFSAEKFKFAYAEKKSELPSQHGGLGYLESALANLLFEFIVYRALPTNTTLTIEHLDSWLARGLSRGDFSADEISDFRAERKIHKLVSFRPKIFCRAIWYISR
jgi:SAM-dependent methyltransferase